MIFYICFYRKKENKQTIYKLNKLWNITKKKKKTKKRERKKLNNITTFRTLTQILHIFNKLILSNIIIVEIKIILMCSSKLKINKK